jgi:hypothetical protein
MAPKKGGAKRKSSGKVSTKNIDWMTLQTEQFVYVEVRNSVWQSMRFTQLMSTSMPLECVRQLIVDRHKVTDVDGLRLFLGEAVVKELEFKEEDYGVPLKELKINGSSKNDHVRQIVTYEYAPFKSVLQLPRLDEPQMVLR